MTWPLPLNNVTENELGHLGTHDNIYACLASGSAGIPRVVTLTDSATVGVNAALGSDFRLATTSGVGNTRVIAAPGNATDGQRITVTITQDATGNRLATWAAGWAFPVSDGPPVLSTAPGFADSFDFTFNAAMGVWMCKSAQYGLTGGTTVFYDGFSQIPSGQLPDASKWGIATGSPGDDPTGGSQWYEANTNNVYVNGSGNLVLAATVQGGGTTTAQARGNYVAPRISTFPEISLSSAATAQGGQKTWTQLRPGFRPFTATYGTFTVVAKVNSTAGFWPAFWCYGVTKLWPQCGEIDLLENFGGYAGNSSTLTQGYGNILGPRNPNDYTAFGWNNAALINHTPASGTGYPINDGNFHTFVMSLNAAYDTITMTVDGAAYSSSPITKTAWLAAAVSAGASAPAWPFGPDNPMGIVLNVCVGAPGSSVPMGYPAGGQTFPLNVMTVQSVKWTVP